jgi:hypothetical protein
MHCSYAAALLVPTPICSRPVYLLRTGEALRGSVADLGGIGPVSPKVNAMCSSALLAVWT